MIAHVRWWNVDRGWGYVVTAEGHDVFVHHAALELDQDLRRGQAVELELAFGTVGLIARNVQLRPDDDLASFAAPLPRRRTGGHPDIYVVADDRTAGVIGDSLAVALDPERRAERDDPRVDGDGADVDMIAARRRSAEAIGGHGESKWYAA